jgi:hypothetical protein
VNFKQWMCNAPQQDVCLHCSQSVAELKIITMATKVVHEIMKQDFRHSRKSRRHEDEDKPLAWPDTAG